MSRAAGFPSDLRPRLQQNGAVLLSPSHVAFMTTGSISCVWWPTRLTVLGPSAIRIDMRVNGRVSALWQRRRRFPDRREDRPADRRCPATGDPSARVQGAPARRQRRAAVEPHGRRAGHQSVRSSPPARIPLSRSIPPPRDGPHWIRYRCFPTVAMRSSPLAAARGRGHVRRNDSRRVVPPAGRRLPRSARGAVARRPSRAASPTRSGS